mmetsp:Transcript_53685/g.153135  ORF Transcript_53685/g.153135 Transcript_53685/m.153135 type:complete len:326 (-) Transcript_53685:394-1371(-)
MTRRGGRRQGGVDRKGPEMGGSQSNFIGLASPWPGPACGGARPPSRSDRALSARGFLARGATCAGGAILGGRPRPGPLCGPARGGSGGEGALLARPAVVLARTEGLRGEADVPRSPAPFHASSSLRGARIVLLVLLFVVVLVLLAVVLLLTLEALHDDDAAVHHLLSSQGESAASTLGRGHVHEAQAAGAAARAQRLLPTLVEGGVRQEHLRDRAAAGEVPLQPPGRLEAQPVDAADDEEAVGVLGREQLQAGRERLRRPVGALLGHLWRHGRQAGLRPSRAGLLPRRPREELLLLLRVRPRAELVALLLPWPGRRAAFRARWRA